MVSNPFPKFENFGNYILLKKLATGGMAEVFLARPATQKGNGRVQVIKRILPHAANNLDFIKMFQTEIQVCLGFNHSHTVQIHDFGEVNSQPYISMEYIEGKTLKDIISKFAESGESMPIPMALSFLAQAASGLSYAHTFVNKVTGEEVRAIHRDISPHNLIVSYDGNLKVIDFGIAKAASRMQDATRAGTIKGKYAYLSPEQISGAPLDARVDIFALGIVAWELLTLRRPFYRAGDSEMTILSTIANCDHNVKAPSYYNGAVPPEVDQIILKALRKDPKERYASAEEFQAALRKVMQSNYPHYSYSDNAKMMESMFAEEIIQERNEIRILNMNVQLSLSNSEALEAQTVVINDPTPPTPAVAAAQKVLGVEMDLRLQSIEKIMKEKASIRHYVLFAFYLISIVVLKLDESYMLFDFLLPQAHTASPAPRAVAARRAEVERKMEPERKIEPERSSRVVPAVRRAPAHVTAKPPAKYARSKPPERNKKAPHRRTVVSQEAAD
jgi:serine/threonine-protein kinase